MFYIAQNIWKSNLKVDLSKLGDVVKISFVKMTVYDELVNKVNAIDTSGLAPNVKIPNFSNLIKKA